jgi:hypothetical protein
MPIKTRVLRELGRALVMGSARELTDALDAAIWCSPSLQAEQKFSQASETRSSR